VDHLQKILSASCDSFGAGQVNWPLGMMRQSGTLEPALTGEQHRLPEATEHDFRKKSGNRVVRS